jgi:hypothetical protein
MFEGTTLPEHQLLLLTNRCRPDFFSSPVYDRCRSRTGDSFSLAHRATSQLW